MPTLNQPDYRIIDTEERSLAYLVELKRAVVRTLALVAEARAAGDRDTCGITDSAELEQLQLSGYERALAFRRTQLAELELVNRYTTPTRGA